VIFDGSIQSCVVVAGSMNSPFCHSVILFSITNPRVYHSALHTGSDSIKDFGLHIFPKSFL
jgi:hypothetical protein